MRADPSRRAVLLLLCCLVVALVFPRACGETRVGLGSLLPATAELTAGTEADPDTDWTEALVRHTDHVRRLRERLAARPEVLPASLSNVQFVEPAQDVVRAVPARLLHRDAGSIRRSYVIDAGSDQGVYRGLAAAHGESLVGVIHVAGRGASRVLRVDDPAKTNVYPAEIIPRALFDALRGRADAGPETGLDSGPDSGPENGPDTRPTGVCRGAGDGTLIVGHLAASDAQPGDIAVTGPGRLGVSSGLVLGRVTRVHDDDRDGVYEATVEPLRNLDTIAAVLVYVRPPLDPALRPAGAK